MSESEMVPINQFALEMMGMDGASVSREENVVRVEVTEHVEGVIDAGPVIETGVGYGLEVTRAYGDIENGVVGVEFVEGL